jgi:hypothetical protein
MNEFRSPPLEYRFLGHGSKFKAYSDFLYFFKDQEDKSKNHASIRKSSVNNIATAFKD